MPYAGVAGDRQAQPGAAVVAIAGGVQPDEPVEHPLAVLRRYPGAVVGDLQPYPVPVGGDHDGRCRVTLLGAVPPDRERAEWAAADLPGRASFLSPHQLADHLAGLRAAGYRDVVAGAHVVILRRQQYR